MTEVFLLSLIQGITEFIPVSSSSHLIIFSKYFNFDNQSLLIDVSLHIGSFLAVITFFYREILNFINNLHIIKDNLFKTPPLFDLIQKESLTDWKEMYKVFNMGHRMELYVPENIANTIIDISKSLGVEAKIIGRVESSNEKKLTISSSNGRFMYQ